MEPLASLPVHFVAHAAKKKQTKTAAMAKTIDCIRQKSKMSDLSETVLQHVGANPVVGLNSLDCAGKTVNTNLT